MALERYAAKRDFKRTPEPRGRVVKSKGLLFVIQKHAARRLHYDLRLELNGVLKSWAVTRGPSLVPGDRRLAVEVEDHPLDYATFEGTIPIGEYGGGRVIVWDRGRWRPVGDPDAALRKGHLTFELEGKKVSGQFHLVRMERKVGKRRNNWLLLKSKDEHARSAEDPDILVERPESVKSGRTIEEIEEPEEASSKPTPKAGRKRTKRGEAKAASAARKAGAASPKGTKGRADDEPAKAHVQPDLLPRVKRGPLPSFVPMEAATPSADAPSGREWIHEIKLDGYRLEARIDHGRVKLLTRSGLDWTGKFKTIAKAFSGLPVDQALIDGEVVAETGEGFSSFSELQADLKEGRENRLVFYAFDLLHLDGYDLTRTPLSERKRALASVLPADPTGFIRLSEHFETDGQALKRHACRIGFEGIISKRASAPYVSGRSRDWLKIKCSNRQELIVVGYVPSTTARRAVGSLALGVFESDALLYVGKVGSGFSTKVSEDLWEQLEPLRRTDAPATIPAESDTRNVRWVEPRLVAEVEFREWTNSGHVRHAVFHGLRLDKDPRDVTREPSVKAKSSGAKPERRPHRATPALKLTHPDRVYWSDAGISKQGLADYYAEVWEWIAPHITDRPLALVRCPGGVGADCFFQKHAWSGIDAALIHATQIGEEQVLSISALSGALALVQAGVIEIHPWGSRIDDPERPDRLIFDLDPGEGVPWPEVERTALELRDRLSATGLRSFAKTTGGKGLHVVAPIAPAADWDMAKVFAQRIAVQMAKEQPNRFVAKMTKSIRGGKIFVDYLRNGRGATAIAAYSPRARPGAPVSTPLAWDELGTGISPAHFTITNLRRRLLSLDVDPWAGMEKLKQRLPA